MALILWGQAWESGGSHPRRTGRRRRLFPHRACEIRLRAERRTGELLKELARATAPNPEGAGGRAHKVVASNDGTQQAPSPYADTLARAGISRQSAHRYQALADVPAETFDAAMREPEKPRMT